MLNTIIKKKIKTMVEEFQIVKTIKISICNI